MLYLSKILIANQELQNFDELKDAVKEFARQGEMFLRFDVKPPFPDTPSDWEDQLEATFNSRY
ncbi:sulfur relay protein DsrC [Thiosocius teredinicola]|uniref:sulfur relay protein DsrC n=1 Tax=Thiosocius teredinicola TaxID=1973002 RepID=UPI000990FBDA